MIICGKMKGTYQNIASRRRRGRSSEGEGEITDYYQISLFIGSSFTYSFSLTNFLFPFGDRVNNGIVGGISERMSFFSLVPRV